MKKIIFLMVCLIPSYISAVNPHISAANNDSKNKQSGDTEFTNAQNQQAPQVESLELVMPNELQTLQIQPENSEASQDSFLGLGRRDPLSQPGIAKSSMPLPDERDRDFSISLDEGGQLKKKYLEKLGGVLADADDLLKKLLNKIWKTSTLKDKPKLDKRLYGKETIEIIIRNYLNSSDNPSIEGLRNAINKALTDVREVARDVVRKKITTMDEKKEILSALELPNVSNDK